MFTKSGKPQLTIWNVNNMKSYSLNEIIAEIKQEELLTFNNLEERVRAKFPNASDDKIKFEMRWAARMQILNIIGSQYSDNEQYRLLKEYFIQKIDGQYLRLPINCKYQANYQQSKALKRLHKEGFIKMFRANNSFGFGIKRNGWKPYGTHQTYLAFNEQNSLHNEVCSV